VGPRGGVENRHIRTLSRLVFEWIEARTAAEPVNGFEAPGRYQPCARICRDAFTRPLLERRPEGIVHRLFGDIEITEKPDQGRKNAARMFDVDGVDRLVHRIGRHADRSHHLRLFSATRAAAPGNSRRDISVSPAWQAPTIERRRTKRGGSVAPEAGAQSVCRSRR